MSDVGDVNRAHSVPEDDIEALVRAAEAMVNPSTADMNARLAWLELVRPGRVYRMGKELFELRAENKRLFSELMGHLTDGKYWE